MEPVLKVTVYVRYLDNDEVGEYVHRLEKSRHSIVLENLCEAIESKRELVDFNYETLRRFVITGFGRFAEE